MFNLILGIQHHQKIIDTEAFQRYGVEDIRTNPHPGCKQYRHDSDEYWTCVIKHETFTTYHPVGACKMGLKSDKSTVVDSQLR